MIRRAFACALVIGAPVILDACTKPPPAASPSAVLNDAEFAACVVSDVVARKPLGGILVDCGRDIPAIVSQVWTLVSGNGLVENPYVSTPAAAEVQAIRDTVTGRAP